MSSLSHCFLDSRGTYIFRLVVPKPLRYLLGVTEIRRSLQTHLPHVAKKRVKELLSTCQHVFNELSSDMAKKRQIPLFRPLAIPPPQMIFRLEKFKVGKIEMEIDSSPQKSEDELNAAVSMLKQLGVEKNVEQIFDTAQSPENLQPDFQNVIEQGGTPSTRQLPESPNAANDFTLREAVNLYLKSREGKVKERTYSSMVADLNHILPLIGEGRRVSSLTVKDAQELFENLKSLPLYWSTRKPYAKLPITQVVVKVRQQIADGKDVQLLGSKRINALSTLMSTWTKWAVKHTALPTPVFSGLKINQRESRTLDRNRGKTAKLYAHQSDEIKKIFNPETYGKWGNALPYKYWCPLIAAFQGMRIEEICDLSPFDFYVESEESEIWYFKIRDEYTDWREIGLTQQQVNALQAQKSVKSLAGERRLPIHSKLLALGLIEYMESRKAGHQIWLFDLKEISNRRSHYPCRWFSEYRKDIDTFVKGQNFHSFRRGVASQFRNQGVAETHMKAILGHQDQALGYKEQGGYSDPLPLQILKNVVESISYPEIDGIPAYSEYCQMAKDSNKQYRRKR